MNVILFIIFCIISPIFVVYGITIFILRRLSPKINKNNVESIGKKCINLLKIDKKKEIKFQIEKNIKISHAYVVKKYRSYVVYIKDDSRSKRVSTLIHELSHIKNGESDRFKDFNTSILKWILNFVFDTISANPNEIKYFKWSKKDLRKFS